MRSNFWVSLILMIFMVGGLLFAIVMNFQAEADCRERGLELAYHFRSWVCRDPATGKLSH